MSIRVWLFLKIFLLFFFLKLSEIIKQPLCHIQSLNLLDCFYHHHHHHHHLHNLLFPFLLLNFVFCWVYHFKISATLKISAFRKTTIIVITNFTCLLVVPATKASLRKFGFMTQLLIHVGLFLVFWFTDLWIIFINNNGSC